jgi:serine/threonine-protein kinase
MEKGRRDPRNDYALEPKPLRHGGQAEIFLAKRKLTNEEVIFKRAHDKSRASLARMRREINVLRELGHPNAMSVLDHSPDYSWYTMPVADLVLADITPPLDDALLVELISDCVQGLAVAHECGWVHRDISPGNIMRVTLEGQPRWVLADWGLVRRPRGMTTALRTRPGVSFGTDGFAAPEMWDDAHTADARADIYGLGRVIAWATTGRWPVPNVPLVPAGRWRGLVEATTQLEASDRPQHIEDLLPLLEATLAAPPRPRHMMSDTCLHPGWQGHTIPPDG